MIIFSISSLLLLDLLCCYLDNPSSRRPFIHIPYIHYVSNPNTSLCFAPAVSPQRHTVTRNLSRSCPACPGFGASRSTPEAVIWQSDPHVICDGDLHHNSFHTLHHLPPIITQTTLGIIKCGIVVSINPWLLSNVSQTSCHNQVSSVGPGNVSLLQSHHDRLSSQLVNNFRHVILY